MEIGDLVKCKYFHRMGVITSPPEHYPRAAGGYVDKIIWVLWCNGKHSKYKTEYLEVVGESK